MGKDSAIVQSKRSVYYAYPDDLFVETDPTKPLFDNRALLALREEMVESIMAHGVLQDVICEKRGTAGPIVVDGRQRVLHAREANKRLRRAGNDPEPDESCDFARAIIAFVLGEDPTGKGLRAYDGALPKIVSKLRREIGGDDECGAK